MASILRISGKNFNLDEFLANYSFRISKIYRKGDRIFTSSQNKKKFSQSGVNIVVSDANFNNLKLAIKDSTKFLTRNKLKLIKIQKSKKMNAEMELDFGIYRRDAVVQVDVFPIKLLALLGKIGISLCISQYPSK